MSGTEPVINQECMLVHEKSGRYVNLSGTAIICVYITVSGIEPGTFFYIIKTSGGCTFFIYSGKAYDFLS